MNFKVNKEKCVKCGKCSSDCPVMIIDRKTEFPTIKEGKEGNCLKCQHCLAICPTGAISIFGKEPENSIPVKELNLIPVELEKLMQTRRSVRKFTDEEIDKEIIDHLISMADYAPSAQNKKELHFTVVDNKKDMNKLRELTYNSIKKAVEENKISENRMFLGNFQEMWEEKHIDVIFRDAPYLLLVSVPKNGICTDVDASIAMTYFDLIASANDIGTLWDGFAKIVFEDTCPEIKKSIGVPENNKIACVLLFGKTGIKYSRSIQNNMPEINRVSL